MDRDEIMADEIVGNEQKDGREMTWRVDSGET